MIDAFRNQLFEVTDIPVIGVLILLEGLLSADNALVLAIMVKHLPEKLRQRALLYGLGGAFVFRAAAILAAAWIMQLWWLQMIGAMYLVFITVKHFLSGKSKHGHEAEIAHKAKQMGFWQTVILVELTDIAFAIDSVLAAVSLAKSNPNVEFERKLWVVYTGAIIGVVLLRFAATVFLRLLDRYPRLEHMAYLLVGWAGVKLLVFSGHNWSISTESSIHIPEMNPIVFWSVLVLILVVGSFYSFAKGSDKEYEDPVIAEARESLEEAEALERASEE